MTKNSLPAGPLTRTGLLFILAAILSGVAGLAAAEPALLLAAFVLLSFITASAIPVIITRFLWKDSLAGLNLPSDTLTPAAVCQTPPRPVVPAASLFLHCRLETGPEGYPALTLTVPVQPVSQPVPRSVLQPVAQPPTLSKQHILTRGIYHITHQALLVTDPARLFRMYIQQEAQTNPILIPADCGETASQLPPATRRQRAKGASTFERSEDLHETRSYMPGDDPRKIHWRAAAHTGELTIRQGELLPPPEALTTVIIYPSSLYTPVRSTTADKAGEIVQQKNLFDLFSARVCALLLTEALISRPVMLITLDPRGTVTTVQLPPGYAGRQELSSRFLAVPQNGTAISPDILFSAVPERSSVLFCCPGHTAKNANPSELSPEIISALHRHSASCTVCIGPEVPAENKQKTLFLAVVSRLRYSSGYTDISSQNHRLFITETLLRKEGISVRRI